MPEITYTPEVNEEAQAAEEAKFEAARQALETEANGGIPEDIKGVYDKYQGDPVKLAQAYRGLQQQISRGERPSGDIPAGEPGTGQAPTPEERVAKMPPADQEKLSSLVSELKGDDPARYDAIAKWAANNISEDTKQAYNSALQEGNTTIAKAIWQGIQYQHMNATGYEPRLAGGRQAGPTETGFKSRGEMTAAMRDPRYNPQSPKFDRAYHEEVAYRTAISSLT